ERSPKSELRTGRRIGVSPVWSATRQSVADQFRPEHVKASCHSPSVVARQTGETPVLRYFTLRGSARADSDLGRCATKNGSACERRARVSATSRGCGWRPLNCRPSGFGLGFLSDFGLRISSFGHELVPLKAARNRRPERKNFWRVLP